VSLMMMIKPKPANLGGQRLGNLEWDDNPWQEEPQSLGETGTYFLRVPLPTPRIHPSIKPLPTP
jgi:hypothetical protein